MGNGFYEFRRRELEKVVIPYCLFIWRVVHKTFFVFLFFSRWQVFHFLFTREGCVLSQWIIHLYESGIFSVHYFGELLFVDTYKTVNKLQANLIFEFRCNYRQHVSTHHLTRFCSVERAHCDIKHVVCVLLSPQRVLVVKEWLFRVENNMAVLLDNGGESWGIIKKMTCYLLESLLFCFSDLSFFLSWHWWVSWHKKLLWQVNTCCLSCWS